MRAHPAEMTRRRWLRLAGCCAAALAGVDALAIEPAWLEVTEHDVPVPDLPAALRGFTIAQLSDLHLSRPGALHERVLAELRARSPSLVVITGDAIEHSESLGALTELCRALAAEGRSVLATPGNWEHWGRVPNEALRDAYRRAGATLLGNESMRLDAGVSIVAIDDHCSGYDDPESAFHRAPAAPFRLLLTHAPGVFDQLPAAAPRFDLGLAGHTHGGQVRALGAAIWTPPGSGRYRAGAYATPKGPIYVSRGVGTSVLPVRFTCRPELPFFKLVAA